MGHVTRHEITQLIEKFEEKVLPPEAKQADHPLRIGVDRVRIGLKNTSGAPSVLLRNFARVLKHYVEAPKDPFNIRYANHVLAILESRGEHVDVVKLIKRAPRDCQVSTKITRTLIGAKLPSKGATKSGLALDKLVDALEEAGVE